MKNNCFICPICGEKLHLSENGASLVCGKETKPHCFDIASEGYVNLDRDHAGGGDSKECVRSRTAFLDKGYYSPIASKMCEILNDITDDEGTLLDAGCGEGFYTSSFARSLTGMTVCGVDISKHAVRHGAKRAKKEGLENNVYAVSSIFALPFENESVDVVTSIFAPCPEEEFSRVLKRGGYLVIAAAGEKHLLGLKKALYDDIYMNEERADMPSVDFGLVKKEKLEFKINLRTNEDILNLFSMTPYYYRTSQRDKEKLTSLSSLESEIEIDFFIYRKG